MSAGARKVTYFQLQADVRPTLDQARLPEAKVAELLAAYGANRVEDLPADRAMDFVRAVADASDHPVFAPPARGRA